MGAKFTLRCQNMFYKGGEVISDQFVHFIIIQRYSLIIAMIRFKNKIRYFLGSFPKRGEGGPLFPNLEAKIPPKSDFFEKNKIAPYGLKCKINHKFFLTKAGFPKGVGPPF